MYQGGRQQAGFTIVEVLIVLSVTGLLLFSGIAFVSGRQDHTQFQISVNNLQQQLQQTLNQTVSGSFKSRGDLRCFRHGDSGPVELVKVASSGQGTNQSCVFIGSSLVFGTTPDSKSYNQYPLAARRQNIDSDKSEVAPTPIAPTSAPRLNYQAPDYTQTMRFDAGMSFVWAKYATAENPATPHQYDNDHTVALDIVSNLTTAGASGNTVSGNRQFDLYGAVLTPATPLTSQTIVDAMYPPLLGTYTDLFNQISDGGIQICIASGRTNQSGLFILGANNDVQVTVSIRDGKVCA